MQILNALYKETSKTKQKKKNPTDPKNLNGICVYVYLRMRIFDSGQMERDTRFLCELKLRQSLSLWLAAGQQINI